MIENGAWSEAEKENRGNGKLFHVLLYCYLIVEFVRPQTVFPFISVLRPGLLLGSTLILFSFWNVADSVYRDSTIRLVGLFTAMAGISAFFAVNNYWAAQATITLILYLLAVMVPAALLMKERQRVEGFVKFWVLIHVYIALFCLTHKGLGPGHFLNDENDVALSLNTAIPFAYFLRQTRVFGSATSVICTTALLLLVAGVVATMSRGGFVGLVVIAGCIVWFSAHRFRNFMAIAVLGLVFFMAIPAEYKNEMYSISDTEDSTRVDRIWSWKLGWQMAVEHPLFGVGAGNYPWRIEEYESRPENYNPDVRIHSGRVAHSLFVTLVAEFGIVGTLLFGSIVFLSVRRMRSVFSGRKALGGKPPDGFLELSSRAVIVSFAGYLSTGAFISVLLYPQMWYLVAISYVIYEQNKREHTSNRPMQDES